MKAERPSLGGQFKASAEPALWLTVLMGVAFALMWSSAFSVAKILVTYTPPFSVLSLRFLVAAAIAGGAALALGQRIPRGAEAWRPIILLGLCQNTLYLGLFFAAMTLIPAGLAAIIASAMPIVAATLAALFFGERTGYLKTAGLALGFAGVVWIMAARITGGVDAFGLALAVGGVLALAVATLTVKRGTFRTGLLMVVACQMLVGGLACIPIALVTEDVTAFTINQAVVLAFSFQVLVPGIAATLLWFSLVKRVSMAGASAFHFLNPVFGIGFAYALLGEPVSWFDMIGVVLVTIGILMVNRLPKAKPVA